MELKDEVFIPAPRDRVYAALNDPEILQACIPGCETLTRTSETQLEATVLLKIGPVKARFGGTVTLEPEAPPARFSLSGQGSGGAAGFARGGAQVELTEAEGGTRLSYDAGAEIGGRLAQLGNRLIQSSSKKLAASFFERFAARMSPPGAG
ncbi:CoxG family protein [Mangrovicoccus algicola]|uniref:Carbon monoxide dehydrogenase subunit G n=1 Tax=Mangrovicoccus algicola TaxID=2771008 RepID=A0A8J6YXM0_9RHOB|nr:carbon monoxide dehydrogenase subunit G [Mangrovicoccus algicola]MBE3639577.1 carbon monoxide dehydrogenase subunit G [Mangrovicoccus algicola]